MKTKLHSLRNSSLFNFTQCKHLIGAVIVSIFTLSLSAQDNGISFDCLDGNGAVVGTITFGVPDGTDPDGFKTWSNGSDGSTSGYTLGVEDDDEPTWSVRQPGSPGPRLFLSPVVQDGALPSCNSSDWQTDLFCIGVNVDCVPGEGCDVNVTISSPVDPIQFGSDVDLYATYSGFTPVAATWYFSSDNINFDYSKSGTVVGNIIEFNNTAPEIPAGVYSVKLVVTDECGDDTEIFHDSYLVIFDPDGGFVTGGGWIYSPLGALVGTTSEGTLNFGLVSQYKKNANGELKGNTNVQFQEGDFHFQSSSYDDMSLVISGEKKATYRGVGTVNGSGSHKFLVIVMDGDANGGDGYDKFRIKVWADGSSSQVIYDNEIGAPENADSSTILGAGSIVIHKPNNKAATQPGASELSLTAWPNPSANSFRLSINSDNSKENIELRVYDINGRLVHSDSGTPDKEFGFGNNFRPGMYIATLKQAAELRLIKLIRY